MQKSILTLIILVHAYCNVVNAQKHDYLWIFGSKTVPISTDPNFGIIHVDFRVDPPEIYIDQDLKNETSYIMYHGYVSVSICDSMGAHQFYSSGARMKNYLHKEMDGAPIGLGAASDSAPQQAVSVPISGQFGRYYFIQDSTYFFVDDGIVRVGCFEVYYSIVDMNENDGEGRLYPKKVKIIENDTLIPGKITAVKHGNGRDWWVLKGGYMQSGKIKKILVLPDTVYVHDTQQAIIHDQYTVGQAVFSPEGSKYVVTAGYSEVYPYGGWYMYDFDRCTGALMIDTFRLFDAPNGLRGAAFSPSGRFLYIGYHDSLYQYDLHAHDPLSSEQVVYIYDPSAAPGHTNPYRSMVGPDGKIYWATAGSTQYLVVIEDPEVAGPGCNVRQALHMGAWMSNTQANYPNYRLGPLDDSPCDTLGLDNIPLAEFRVRSDSTLTVRFIDRSAYEPEVWSWTFGDGGTSMEVHPTHTYATSGAYEVCLTVSNTNGTDTYCRTITLGTVATEDIRQQAQVTVFPNPATDYLNINIAGFHPVGARLELSDMLGRTVLHEPLPSGLHSIPVYTLPSGMYVWRVLLGGEPLATGKVVVQ